MLSLLFVYNVIGHWMKTVMIMRTSQFILRKLHWSYYKQVLGSILLSKCFVLTYLYKLVLAIVNPLRSKMYVSLKLCKWKCLLKIVSIFCHSNKNHFCRLIELGKDRTHWINLRLRKTIIIYYFCTNQFRMLLQSLTLSANSILPIGNLIQFVF